MNDGDFAKIVRSSDGRQVLFFIEQSGTDFILNQIAQVPAGAINVKLEFGSRSKQANEYQATVALNSAGQDQADRVIAFGQNHTSLRLGR